LGALESTYDKEPLDTTVGQALFFLLTTVNHISVVIKIADSAGKSVSYIDKEQKIGIKAE
jgi:hypothetical protein